MASGHATLDKTSVIGHAKRANAARRVLTVAVACMLTVPVGEGSTEMQEKRRFSTRKGANGILLGDERQG